MWKAAINSRGKSACRQRRMFLLCVGVAHFVAICLCAEEPPTPDPLPPPPNPSNVRPVPETTVTTLDDGRLRIGKVILDKGKRTLTLPAEVNMNHELVEYFLVTGTGKLHESILRTEAAPYHVHIAMLLLGAKGAVDADPSRFHDPTSELPGDRIQILVSWKQGHESIEKRAEDLVQNMDSKKAMAHSPWVYNGSRLVDGSFVAQNEGSLVSLISDQGALANNPQTGRDNDENWAANAALVPPVKTAVEVTFQLDSAASPVAPAPTTPSGAEPNSAKPR